MGYNAKVGSFNIDSSVTAGNDQSVTGVGFQPKVVLFWWSGSTATSDTVAGGTYNCGVGAATSSSSRWCIMFISEDAQADSDTRQSSNDTECIRCYTDTATLDGLADFNSMDADGFTLTIDDQFSQDYRINYLALGGTDLTNVYCGTATEDVDTGNYDVTGIGFQPDALVIGKISSTTKNTSGTWPYWSFGFATGSSNQGHVFAHLRDAQATSFTRGYGYNSEVVTRGDNDRNAFVEFIADGFTLNKLQGTAAHYIFFVCLKGGQYLVNDLTTRTDSNDIEEDVGFEPAAILFASANRALSTQATVTNDARISIGAGTSTSERAVQAISDENGLADTETAYANYDSAVYAHVKDDAIEALMDIKSFDADGFTCVMDDAETSACWVTYLAIGAAAAAGGVPAHMMHYARLRRS